LKITSPEEIRMVGEAIAPKTTSRPPSPSIVATWPLASPPTGRCRTDRGSPGESAHLILPVLGIGRDHVAHALRLELGDPLHGRTRLTTCTPRAAPSWATMRPTAPFAAFWIIQSPVASPSESSTLIALNGMDPSCAACSSGCRRARG
jgi:hypothetical protein